MTESDARRDTKSAGPERTFIHDEVLWRVRELPSVSYDRRSARRLVFESDAAIRTVRTYPSDWQELPRDELMALSWGK